MDDQQNQVKPEMKVPAPSPGKTYLRLLSFLEGDIQMDEAGKPIHAFFIVVEDLYGNQGVVPVVVAENYWESVRKTFQRLKPFAMYALDVDPKEIDGQKMNINELREVKVVDEGIKDKH